MATQIFVNLPVKDLDASVDFFTSVGYTFNPQFTDENATCMIVADGIYVMLLMEPFFSSFTPKKIADTSTHAEAILGLSADSREHVDEIVDRALAAGGTSYKDPDDSDMMYSRAYEDLDGHIWEIIWMDPAMIEA